MANNSINDLQKVKRSLADDRYARSLSHSAFALWLRGLIDGATDSHFAKVSVANRIERIMENLHSLSVGRLNFNTFDKNIRLEVNQMNLAISQELNPANVLVGNNIVALVVAHNNRYAAIDQILKNQSTPRPDPTIAPRDDVDDWVSQFDPGLANQQVTANFKVQNFNDLKKVEDMFNDKNVQKVDGAKFARHIMNMKYQIINNNYTIIPIRNILKELLNDFQQWISGQMNQNAYRQAANKRIKDINYWNGKFQQANTQVSSNIAAFGNSMTIRYQTYQRYFGANNVETVDDKRYNEWLDSFNQAASVKPQEKIEWVLV